MESENNDHPRRLLHRKKNACDLLDIPLTTLDELIADGILETVPLGIRGVRITDASVQRVAREGARRRYAAGSGEAA